MTISASKQTAELAWPALPLKEWESTYQTLHMWAQIVGKIRMALTPLQNHFWNVALYVSSCGLTTSAMPCGEKAFELQFNFIDHVLELRTSRDGTIRTVRLAPKSVAEFYREVFSMLQAEGIAVKINPKSQEVANPIPFDQDTTHASYDPEYSNRLLRILWSTNCALQEFRSSFVGKCSPVHFFWGSFDLCCTRFSGRSAPPRKGVITGEAYSHECSSVGWWPGTGDMQGPAFYAYMAPEPAGYGERLGGGRAAVYNPNLHEFLLPYDEVRRAESPDAEILEFARATYAAGADLAKWDRAALERKPR